MSGQSQTSHSERRLNPLASVGTRRTWYTSWSSDDGAGVVRRVSGPRKPRWAAQLMGPTMLVKAMGWRVKPAWGLASEALEPERELETVDLPAPAPPTTTTCRGVGSWPSRAGPMTLRATAEARRSSPARRPG